MKFLAQAAPQETDLGRIGGTGFGPFGEMELSPTSGLRGITNTVSSVIGIMTIAAGIWFMFMFVYGGYEWIQSSGDKAKLQSARDRMSHAFVGFTIVIAAWSILALTGRFFGVDLVIGNPEKIIEQLKLGP